MKRSIFFVVIAAILLTACGAAKDVVSTRSSNQGYIEPGMATGGGAPSVDMAPMATMAPVQDSSKTTEGYSPNAPVPAGDAQQPDRLVIQNADLAIVVKDPKAKMDAVAAMAKSMGGFVVSMNLSQTYANDGTKVPDVYIVVRVPAEKLQDALSQIKTGVGEVQYENISGQDVTSQYTDLKSRLKNYEAAEQQLQTIMDKAEKTEDVISVFNQLVYYREQIEIVKGQMNYYEESAALSAISLHVIAEQTVQPIEVGGWKPQGTVRDALQNLLYFFQSFVDFLIWFVLNFLIKLLAILLVFGTPLWLIVRGMRNAWRKRRTAKVAATQIQPATTEEK